MKKLKINSRWSVDEVSEQGESFKEATREDLHIRMAHTSQEIKEQNVDIEEPNRASGHEARSHQGQSHQ